MTMIMIMHMIMQTRTLRTAAAPLDLSQARAAGRRSPVSAAQREAPEQAPAARQRPEQGRAVLSIGARDGRPAAVVRRSFVDRQELPAWC